MIAWSYAREVRRTALPVPEASAVTGPMLAGLCHGDIDPTISPRFVRVTDLATGTAQYVSILTAAAGNGFPAQDLELPGGEWLEILTDIPGVEASVRGVNHGQVGSRAPAGPRVEDRPLPGHRGRRRPAPPSPATPSRPSTP